MAYFKDKDELLLDVMPRVPVIVLTRRTNVDLYLKVMSLGAFDYMSKPVEVSELRRIVRAALREPEQCPLSKRRR